MCGFKFQHSGNANKSPTIFHRITYIIMHQLQQIILEIVKNVVFLDLILTLSQCN